MEVGQKAVIYGDDTGVSGDDAGIAFISSFGQGAPAFVSARKLGPNNPKVGNRCSTAVVHLQHTWAAVISAMLCICCMMTAQPAILAADNCCSVTCVHSAM
jgi:hypothetical protein